MKQITIKHIAAELDLAVSTVSRALNDHPNITKKTKELVNETAKRLGYQPNFIARNLKSNKSDMIGIIVPEIRHFFFSSAISGIEEVAYKKGYTTVISQSNEDVEREIINVNSMYFHRVSGIVAAISQGTKNSSHFQNLIDQGVNIVFFDRVCEDLNVPKVTIDDFGSSYRMTKFLIDKGYKKIVHFGGPSNLSICQRRSEGYKKAISESKVMDEGIVFEGGMIEEDGYNSVSRMLEAGIDKCAILAVNDPVAVGALKKLKELKIEVPAQIGIAGFSNNPITEIITSKITTIDQPSLEMGRKAAELLIEQIDNPDKKNKAVNIVLETKMIIRESA